MKTYLIVVIWSVLSEPRQVDQPPIQPGKIPMNVKVNGAGMNPYNFKFVMLRVRVHVICTCIYSRYLYLYLDEP